VNMYLFWDMLWDWLAVLIQFLFYMICVAVLILFLFYVIRLGSAHCVFHLPDSYRSACGTMIRALHVGTAN